MIAEGSKKDLRMRGGPGINSSLPTSGKRLTVLATDVPTLGSYLTINPDTNCNFTNI